MSDETKGKFLYCIMFVICELLIILPYIIMAVISNE